MCPGSWGSVYVLVAVRLSVSTCTLCLWSMCWVTLRAVVRITLLLSTRQCDSFGKHPFKAVVYRRECCCTLCSPASHTARDAACLSVVCILPLHVPEHFWFYFSSERLWKAVTLEPYWVRFCLLHWKMDAMPLSGWKGKILFVHYQTSPFLRLRGSL